LVRLATCADPKHGEMHMPRRTHKADLVTPGVAVRQALEVPTEPVIVSAPEMTRERGFVRIPYVRMPGLRAGYVAIRYVRMAS
jgi:hypothetical protein